MTTCPACDIPIGDGKLMTRTFCSCCDPYARIERLEKALTMAREYVVTCLDDNQPGDPGFCEVTADLEHIDAALKTEGREGC
jgi:hypothetical protein